MVSRELATLGFDFPDDEALRKAVLGETGMQAFPTAGFDAAHVYQDPSGPRVTLFRTGNQFLACPGFAADTTVESSVFRVSPHVTAVELRRAVDPNGPVFNRVAAASDEAFALPNERLRAAGQLVGIVTQAQLYPDADTWRADSDSTLDEPAFLFSPSLETYYSEGDAAAVGPYGLLTAELREVDTRRNALTGQSFAVSTVATPAGLITLVFPPELEPTPGAIVDGPVFLTVAAGYWDMALQRAKLHNS